MFYHSDIKKHFFLSIESLKGIFEKRVDLVFPFFKLIYMSTIFIELGMDSILTMI